MTIYAIAPDDFNPIRVAECFIECGDQVLFLKRSQNVPHPGTWALPGGKLEKGEIPAQAVCREIFEECGFTLSEPSYLHTLYLRHNEYDYTDYIFRQVLRTKPKIKINLRESDNYAWLSFAQATELNARNELIFDLMPCIELVYKNSEFGGL